MCCKGSLSFYHCLCFSLLCIVLGLFSFRKEDVILLHFGPDPEGPRCMHLVPLAINLLASLLYSVAVH